MNSAPLRETRATERRQRRARPCLFARRANDLSPSTTPPLGAALTRPAAAAAPLHGGLKARCELKREAAARQERLRLGATLFEASRQRAPRAIAAVSSSKARLLERPGQCASGYVFLGGNFGLAVHAIQLYLRSHKQSDQSFCPCLSRSAEHTGEQLSSRDARRTGSQLQLACR